MNEPDVGDKIDEQRIREAMDNGQHLSVREKGSKQLMLAIRYDSTLTDDSLKLTQNKDWVQCTWKNQRGYHHGQPFKITSLVVA